MAPLVGRTIARGTFLAICAGVSTARLLTVAVFLTGMGTRGLAGCVGSSQSAPDGGAGDPDASATSSGGSEGVCVPRPDIPNSSSYVPFTSGGGDGCLIWECTGGGFLGRWACDSGAPSAKSGSGCGSTPADYDGCLVWTCGADGSWSGVWTCFDTVACPPCEAGASCASYPQPMPTCNTAHELGAPSQTCYCDPKQGGWVCKSTHLCDEAGTD